MRPLIAILFSLLPFVSISSTEKYQKLKKASSINVIKPPKFETNEKELALQIKNQRRKSGKKSRISVYNHFGNQKLELDKDAQEVDFDLDYDGGVEDGERSKRFYNSPQLRCNGGFLCCQTLQCRQFCPLCFIGFQSSYGPPDRCRYSNQCDDEPTTPRCVDKNKNDVCDEDEEGEEQKADPDDEGEEQKADPSDEEGEERKADPSDPLGRLEFTHHIYEEYQPVYPKESKPPIILHSVPHYSVANYFTLNKHLQHYPNYDQSKDVHEDHHLPEAHSGPAITPSSPQSQIFYGDLHSRPSPLNFVDVASSHPTHGDFASANGELYAQVPLSSGDHLFPHSSYPGPTANAYSPPAPTGTAVNVYSAPAPPVSPYSAPGQLGSPGSSYTAPQAPHYLSQNYLPGGPPFPPSQTFVFDHKDDSVTPTAPSPQPLLKYHLIHQSFPSKGSKLANDDGSIVSSPSASSSSNYRGDIIPAFLPGPPYQTDSLQDFKVSTTRQDPRIESAHNAKANKSGGGNLLFNTLSTSKERLTQWVSTLFG